MVKKNVKKEWQIRNLKNVVRKGFRKLKKNGILAIKK